MVPKRMQHGLSSPSAFLNGSQGKREWTPLGDAALLLETVVAVCDGLAQLRRIPSPVRLAVRVRTQFECEVRKWEEHNGKRRSIRGNAQNNP